MKATCSVSDLFHIQYGNSLELIYLNKKEDGINFVSRTSKRNGVSAKVEQIAYLPPFHAGLITVAVGGSVLETFLQPKPFYTGFHVMVLTPRVKMSNATKLYYCQCIRQNQYKYSYGRQANSSLHDLKIPSLESVPDYVRTFSLQEYGTHLLQQIDFPLDCTQYKKSNRLLPLGALFEVINGIPSVEVIRSKTKDSENWVPFIRPSYRQETSIDAYVNINLIPQAKVFPAETLYVSTDGQGSHTYSYVSTFTFVPNSNVAVLIPKRKMGLQEKLFYAQCITSNRYKFSYGRKPKGDRLKSVLLPEYPPEYVLEYNIDEVMKSYNTILQEI